MDALREEQPQTRDTLLTAVRWLLTALLWLTIIGAVIAFVMIPVAYAMRREAGLQLVAENYPSVAGLLALAGIAAIIGYHFIRHLRRIVDSVALGDPFAPENADRLRAMAWLALAYQAVQVPMAGLLVWWDAAPLKANVHHGDDGISLATIILALILFILARVFRQGAAMRADLEGTV